MKKIILITLIGCTLLITGCGDNNKSGVMTCTSETSPSAGVELSSAYTIYYEEGYVTKLKTNEELVVEDGVELDTYKETLESAYAQYNTIEHYSNVITVKDNTLISSTVINYEKIDTDKLISIDDNNASLIKNGKVSINDVIDLYENNGATCK